MSALAGKRVLVSNDDGVHAEGLRHLADTARELGAEVWIVAPERDHSGAGHSLTIADPVRLRRLGDRVFAVSGTPTDCVLVAVLEAMREAPPHLVLSGINRGGNLGEDITYSGTVAAAMEGALLGVPSIALSQDTDRLSRARWETARRCAPGIVAALVGAGWPSNVFLNVNFPDVAAEEARGPMVTRQGRRKPGSSLDRRKDPRGRPYYWIDSERAAPEAEPGTDMAAVARGFVSVTPLHLDLTHEPARAALAARLG